MSEDESKQEEGVPADRSWRSEKGQVLVIFAAGLMLFIGMVALAVDAGFLMAERRQVQSAADAGALAAAKAKLDYLYDPSSNQIQIDTGKKYGSENAAVSPDDVDVDPDPDMDGFDDVYIDDGVNRYVEVDVRKDVTSFFLRALYDGDWGTSATAVAGIEPIPRQYALVALDCPPDGNGGIHIAGGAKVDVHEGSIMSNCGITSTGAAGSSEVLAGESIDAHGEIQDGPEWCGGPDCTSINENQPTVSDPIKEAEINSPSESAAKSQREVIDDDSIREAITNLTDNHSNPHRCPSGETCVMQPGFYGGDLTGLNVRGELVMEQGIYYFDDDFVLEGQSENTYFVGEGVLLYFTGNSTFEPKNAQMELASIGSLAESCEANLDAVVIWIENGTSFEMQSGAANFQFDGVFYAPESHVELYGGPYASGVQVIVQSLTLSGGNEFDIPYTECVPTESSQIFLVR